MIDLQLLSELADVIRCCNKYQVCFVGDDGQLPPMSRGEVFRQLTLPDLLDDSLNICRIRSVVKVHHLRTCYRTNSRELFDACQALRQGNLVIDDKDSADPSWEVHLASTDADVYTELRRRICKIDVECGSFPQYIAWQNKDVRKINEMVQDHLLNRGMLDARDVWEHGSVNRFHKGDKVVYVGDNLKKNGMELTNAMTGNVVSAGIGGMTIAWEGIDGGQMTMISSSAKSVPSPNDVQLAYCVTVHKSQGSEHDVIIVPCLEVEKMKLCLDRRWLYTAATRAKQRAVIIATPNISGFVSKSVSAIPLNSLFDQ
jgi:exodeoxyribonuclease V alpha subunit